MIYLDHNATCPVRAEVVEAMAPWFAVPSNPSSIHQLGQRARAAVEHSRRQVAALLGRAASGVVFTSGATESNATWWHAQRALGRQVIALSPMEHPSSRLAAQGCGLTLRWLEVSRDGVAQLGLLDVDGVSLMLANHETGVLQPVGAAMASGLPVHVDATQAVGRVPLDLADAEAVCFSGHKLGGPPGTGVLSLRGGQAFPSLHPGAQERGRRGGTVNVAGVVGLGVACQLAQHEQLEEARRLEGLQASLEARLRHLGADIVGQSVSRLPQTTCAVFPGVPGELLVQALDLRGVAVSSGAACASGSTEPSPVLVAMGHAHPSSSVRVSLGKTTQASDLDVLMTALSELMPALADLEAS